MDKPEGTSATSHGSTTIAPGVLITLARLTALSVPGVAAMAPVPAALRRLLKRNTDKGILLELDDDEVSIDLHLVLDQDTNVRQVSRKVQQEVARAIEEMVGMNVRRIDIHIEDIDYGEAQSGGQ
jgi:uncharacterized alkaline shock family protein YloU